MPELRKVSVKLHSDIYDTISNIAKQNGESISETIRMLIEEGLTVKVSEKNADLLASVVREQLQIVLKPNIERLAAISSKSGHISAAAAFLNVQALMDLVPTERRRDVRAMFDKAKQMGAEYMRTKTDDWKVDDLRRNDD